MIWKNHYCRSILAILALLAATVGAEEQASVHPKFSEAISDLAGEIIKFVTTEPETDGAVRVGTWQGPGGGGSVISVSLRDQLGSKLSLKKVGGYSISGQYEQDQNTSGKHVTVITASLKNPAGNEVHVFRRRLVTDDRMALELFGTTLDNTAASNTTERQLAVNSGKTPERTPIESQQKVAENIRRQIANPATSTAVVNSSGSGPGNGSVGSLVRYSNSSPYAVELLVRNAKDDQYHPCSVSIEDGIPHTNITAEQVYAIKIHNNTDAPVGVSIAIDGINTYAFSDNPYWKQLGKTLIHPRGGIIRGWAGRGTAVNEFTIVEYGKSAAAELGLVDGIGSITVIFYPVYVSKGATGRGRELDHELRPVHAQFSDEILGSVSIKYLRESIPTDLPE
jgi:hypothetical protein